MLSKPVLDSPNNVCQGGLLLYIQFFPHKVIYGHRTTENLHASYTEVNFRKEEVGNTKLLHNCSIYARPALV